MHADNLAKRVWRDSSERWKWAYGQVEQEAQRTTTTEAEIVDAYWKFSVPSSSIS